jgi:hypothetical protein
MVDYEIGCVLFLDNEIIDYEKKKLNIPTGTNGIGYSSSKGFFKVEHYSQLEDDIFWITNFPKEFFVINHVSTKNIKPDNFFKIKLNSLIYELGMTGLHRQIIAKEISIIGKNTIDRLQKNYKFNLNNSTLPQVLSESFNLKNILTLYDKNYFQQEQQNFFITDLKKDVNEIQVYLKFPRYDYIRELCKASFPDGEWSLLNNNLKNGNNKKVFNKIVSNKDFAKEFISKYKCCINVKLTNIDPKIEPLLPNDYKHNQIMINDQEYLYFSMYSNIHINDIYICKKKKHLQDIEPKKLFKQSELEKGSISSGLAAYSYLYSFLDLASDSSISNWIKIKDRLKMLDISKKFLEQNIKVLSYGNGGLLISVEEKNIYNVIVLAEKIKLIYPTVILLNEF